MKKFIKNNKFLFIRLCILVGLMVFFFVLMAIKDNKDAAEAYSRGLGRVIFTVVAATTKYIPVSVTEFFAVTCVILVIFWIVKCIKDFKKGEKYKGIGRIVNIFVLGAMILTMTTATMEVQYNRKAVPIPQYEEKVEKGRFLDIITYFLADYNKCARQLEFTEDGNVISPYSIAEINDKLAKDYKRLQAEEFDGYFGKFTTNLKPMVSSEIYSQLNITGLTFGALGECNINTSQPMAGIPFTMAHELAHSKGVLREDDANLTALYLMLTSDDYFFRFSGYFQSFNRILYLATYTGNDQDYSDLYWSLDKSILDCYSYDSVYWRNHDLLQEIGDFWNDLYLKSSGTEGTSSYNDTEPVVDEEKEEVIYFSSWQKIYFDIFFKHFN